LKELELFILGRDCLFIFFYFENNNDLYHHAHSVSHFVCLILSLSFLLVSFSIFSCFADCPANATLTTQSTSCVAPYDYANPTVTDNCANPLSFRSSNVQNKQFPPGVWTEAWLAFDVPTYNQAECSFTVTVTDATPPTIGQLVFDWRVSSEGQ
jgi:hypothetical protein